MPDIVRLDFDKGALPHQVERALASASVDAARRVEVAVDADVTRGVRHALHRHGFRLEGRGRQERLGPDGFVDVLHYARLADDPTENRQRFTAVMNTVTPRKRLIAHALVLDAAGRVLLCETSFKPDFELPGGIVEPNESPRTGLEREIVEELGAPLTVGRPLLVDWLRPYLGWEDALELVFAAEQVSDAEAAALVPDGQEIVALHWVAPDVVSGVMTPFGADRVLTALRALSEGTTLYSEGGQTLA